MSETGRFIGTVLIMLCSEVVGKGLGLSLFESVCLGVLIIAVFFMAMNWKR